MKVQVMIDALTIFEEKAKTFSENRPVVFSKPENSDKLPELIPLDDRRSVTVTTATHALAVVPKTELKDLWETGKLSKTTLLNLFGMVPEDLTNSNS